MSMKRDYGKTVIQKTSDGSITVTGSVSPEMRAKVGDKTADALEKAISSKSKLNESAARAVMADSLDKNIANTVTRAATKTAGTAGMKIALDAKKQGTGISMRDKDGKRTFDGTVDDLRKIAKTTNLVKNSKPGQISVQNPEVGKSGSKIIIPMQGGKPGEPKPMVNFSDKIKLDPTGTRFVLDGASKDYVNDKRIHQQLKPGEVAVSVFDNTGTGDKGEDHKKGYFVVTSKDADGKVRTQTFWGRIGNKHATQSIPQGKIAETFDKRSSHGYGYRGTVTLSGKDGQSLTNFLKNGSNEEKTMDASDDSIGKSGSKMAPAEIGTPEFAAEYQRYLDRKRWAPKTEEERQRAAADLKRVEEEQVRADETTAEEARQGKYSPKFFEVILKKGVSNKRAETVKRFQKLAEESGSKQSPEQLEKEQRALFDELTGADTYNSGLEFMSRFDAHNLIQSVYDPSFKAPEKGTDDYVIKELEYELDGSYSRYPKKGDYTAGNKKAIAMLAGIKSKKTAKELFLDAGTKEKLSSGKYTVGYKQSPYAYGTDFIKELEVDHLKGIPAHQTLLRLFETARANERGYGEGKVLQEMTNLLVKAERKSDK